MTATTFKPAPANILPPPVGPDFIPPAVAEYYDPAEFATLAGAVRVLGGLVMYLGSIGPLVDARQEAHQLARCALDHWLALDDTEDVTEWRDGIDGLDCGVCGEGVGWDTDYRDPDARFEQFVMNGDDIVCGHCIEVIRS